MAIFKIEMKKVFKGKLFWLVIAFAVVLTVLSAVYELQSSKKDFDFFSELAQSQILCKHRTAV